MERNRLDHQFFVEVRRYLKDPNTGIIQPTPTESARILPNQAALFGTTLDRPIIISGGNTEDFLKKIIKERDDLKAMGILTGLAIANPLSGLTLELPNGKKDKADLSGGHKYSSAYVFDPESALLGVIGLSPEEVEQELTYRENIFPKQSENE